MHSIELITEFFTFRISTTLETRFSLTENKKQFTTTVFALEREKSRELMQRDDRRESSKGKAANESFIGKSIPFQARASTA